MRSTRGRRGVARLPWVFQHDNAAVHTVNVVERFLRHRGAKVLPWPALSPDLSPIENLWAIVSKKVYSRYFPTVEALWAAIQQEWNSTPVEVLHHLYDSMPDRLTCCLKAHGYPIRY